jgi:GDP-L-fucose synthase
MEKNSRIYVAGHKGLVGSAIVNYLKSDSYTNIITRTHAETDLTGQKETEDLIRNESPEYVFLAAAKVGGILANNTYKAEFIYKNTMIAANVIHFAYKYGIKKILNLGSSCIYPKFSPQPMKEEHILTGKLEPTNEPYAIAKITAIKLCRYYNEQFGTNFISAMPANLYGCNDNFNLETSHVLPALMRKFHLAKLLKKRDFEAIRSDFRQYSLGFNLDNEVITYDDEMIRDVLRKLGITEDYVILWGSGESYRELLYVDDLANACVFLMKKYEYGELGEFVNIGTGEDIKVKELAVLIKEIVGFQGEIKHDLTKPEGTPKKLLDVTKMKEIGWEAKTSLRDGIRKTYEWYRINREKIF